MFSSFFTYFPIIYSMISVNSSSVVIVCINFLCKLKVINQTYSLNFPNCLVRYHFNIRLLCSFFYSLLNILYASFNEDFFHLASKSTKCFQHTRLPVPCHYLDLDFLWKMFGSKILLNLKQFFKKSSRRCMDVKKNYTKWF